MTFTGLVQESLDGLMIFTNVPGRPLEVGDYSHCLTIHNVSQDSGIPRAPRGVFKCWTEGCELSNTDVESPTSKLPDH